jgi:hypothetical protein
MPRHAEADHLDSEDANRSARDQVRALIVLPYNHDHQGGLPLRAEVAGFALNALCRPDAGWLRPGDAGPPVVRLKRDGTLLLWWRRGRRWLRIHVPTLDVLVATTIEEGCEITATLGDDPVADRPELDRMFRWLRGDE